MSLFQTATKLKPWTVRSQDQTARFVYPHLGVFYTASDRTYQFKGCFFCLPESVVNF